MSYSDIMMQRYREQYGNDENETQKQYLHDTSKNV